MKTIKTLSQFEDELVSFILNEEIDINLSNSTDLLVIKRENNNTSFYTYFSALNQHINKDGGKGCKTLGKSVFIKLPKVKYGAGCMLYIENGIITMLEVYSHASERLVFDENNFEFTELNNHIGVGTL